jgi:DNA polymerase V
MIAIIDCNSFYASCEQLFRPDLKGAPIVVLSNNDGCIIARNDKAKELGVKMGEPFFKAHPFLVEKGIHFFSSNYPLYADMSRRVMKTLQQINPDIEVYSVDEAFLDVSRIKTKDYKSYALDVKNNVFQNTGIPVSIGIAPTKVLAKVANRIAKKNKSQTQGVFVLETKEEIEQALKNTDIGDIWGIGKRNAQKLKELFDIYNAYEFYSRITESVARKFFGGVVGVRLLREIRGEPSIFVQPGKKEKKHIATTRSFGKPVTNLADLKEAVSVYAERALQKLESQQTACRTIGVFIRTDPHQPQSFYSNVQYVTLSYATYNPIEVIEQAQLLVEQIYLPGYEYQKVGVFLSGFEGIEQHQLSLFEMPEQRQIQNNKHEKIAQILANSQKRYGSKKVSCAVSEGNSGWRMRSAYRSPEYTTNWNDIPLADLK